MGKSFCSALRDAFPRTLLLQKLREKEKNLYYLWICPEKMPDVLRLCRANVSCFRLQACFRKKQFDLPLLLCILTLLLSLNPAAGMWGLRGGFSVGSGLIPEGHLHWFRIIESFRLEKSPSPTITLMLPGLPLNHVPKPRVLCQGLKIYPMIHGNHSTFLRRRPGGVLWNLAGMFCKASTELSSPKHWGCTRCGLAFPEVALAVMGWHQLLHLSIPQASGEGPQVLITHHRPHQALSGHITISSWEKSFSSPSAQQTPGWGCRVLPGDLNPWCSLALCHSSDVHLFSIPPEHTIIILLRLLPDTPKEPFAVWQVTDEDFQPLLGVNLDREISC